MTSQWAELHIIGAGAVFSVVLFLCLHVICDKWKVDKPDVQLWEDHKLSDHTHTLLLGPTVSLLT